jgi:uroporphyrin-3 C-methyltransferase
MTDEKKPQANAQSQLGATTSTTTESNKGNDLENAKSPNKSENDTKSSQAHHAQSNKAQEKQATTKPKQKKIATKTNKLAWLAIIIALSAGAAVGGLYYWQNQQQSQLSHKFSQQIAQQTQQTQQLLQQSQLKTQALLTEQQQVFEQQLAQAITAYSQQQQTKITQLENALARLSERQPSDWLINESEYLIRIAARSIWLQRDTTAAINLLKDADSRLKKLNNPEFFPIRQLIHQDIEQLSLLPQRETDEVILSLMGLNQQIDKLPLRKIMRIDEKSAQQDLQLSEDPSDWQSNLKKSWQKFLNDFITIRRRNENVEPLLSPAYVQNLRQNLSLKLQLAQWAANQGKTPVYKAALNDVITWQEKYFDMDAPSNQNFSRTIKKLSKAIIEVDYPKSLSSLQAFRQLLASKKISPLTSQDEQPINTKTKQQEETTKKKEVDKPTGNPQPNGAVI